MKKKKKITPLMTVLIIILSLCIAGAAVLSVLYFTEKGTADKEQQAMIQLKENVISTDSQNPVRNKKSGNATARISDDDPLKRVIDFDALLKINDEVGFWLYIPGTSIDYPVMLTDQDTYLTYDIFGNTGTGGSLFAYRHSAASDCMFIWGHHARGYERTFGDLPDFLEEEYARERQKAYLYLPGGSVEVYDLYTALDTTPSDFAFREDYARNLPEKWDRFIRHLETTGEYYFRENEQLESSDKLLALSTCTDWFMTRRTIVVFLKG